MSKLLFLLEHTGERHVGRWERYGQAEEGTGRGNEKENEEWMRYQRIQDGWVRCEKVGCFMSSGRRSACVAERDARDGGTSAHGWWRERLPNSANYGFVPLTLFHKLLRHGTHGENIYPKMIRE